MKIRLATEHDADEVLGLLDELVACVLRNMENPTLSIVNPEERKAMYKEAVNRSDIKFFVVEEKGKLIALSDLMILPIVRRGKQYGHIEDFVVSETMRGKGIGAKLLENIKQYCRDNTIFVIKLTSGFVLPEAHKFYEKNGGEFTEKMFRFDL